MSEKKYSEGEALLIALVSTALGAIGMGLATAKVLANSPKPPPLRKEELLLQLVRLEEEEKSLAAMAAKVSELSARLKGGQGN